MKKFSIIFAVIFIITLSFNCLAADSFVAQANGFTNVPFSNGYNGFCIDQYKKGAYIDDVFTEASDTTAATSNVDDSDISQYLKIFFTALQLYRFVCEPATNRFLPPNPPCLILLLDHFSKVFLSD